MLVFKAKPVTLPLGSGSQRGVGLAGWVTHFEGLQFQEGGVDLGDGGKRRHIHLKPNRIVHLRDQAQVCHRHLVTDTELSRYLLQQTLQSVQPFGDEVLGPFQFLLFPNLLQHTEILQGLDARGDVIRDHPDLGTFLGILGQQPWVGPGLFQVMDDSQRLGECDPIDEERWHLLHGIQVLEGVGMLLPSVFDQIDGNLFVFDSFESESNAHSP